MSRTITSLEPCPNCRNPLAWLSAGSITCTACESVPPEPRRKLLLVETDGRREWVSYEQAKIQRTPAWKRK
jgi:LSD1 subclass zinc finger protein